MPSTFFGLNTAYLGLSAANASLNTTSNNIANVETEGYSRQYTVQKASEAIRVYAAYGCAGSGVEVLAIERHRDEFYDEKYWRNNNYAGEYETKEYYMKQIEDYFRDDGNEEGSLQGFSTIFENMYTALAEVKKNSGTDETRRNFLGTAEELTEYFNAMAGNLQKIQKDINSELRINVDRINALADELVTLNKQINVIEISGGIANELRDQRALVIDELSTIVDVSVEEMPIIDPHNPDSETGATRYIVKIAGGQTLVDNQMINTLECIARGDDEKINQSDADGLYDIVWSNGNTFSLKNESMGGKLQALAELRDGNNGEYFHGTITNTDIRTIDGTKHSVITVEVNEAYLKDMNKCTLPENGGKISLGNREVYFDSWTMHYNASADSYTYEFVLSDKTKNENTSIMGLVGKEAAIGSRMEYQGVPYYMEQMNEWIRCYAKTFNDIMTQDGAIDNYGNDAQFMFRADLATDDGQWTFRDSYEVEADGSYTISDGDDSYYWLTALNFSVCDEMLDDPSLMATHTGNADEESKYDVVDDLIDLKTNVDRMKFRGCSSNQFLQCILSDISLNAQSANDFSASYAKISATIANQRLSVSGVDGDEEALNLVKYQNAYTLASKMIQTLTEIYDRLILETGV